MVLEVEDDLGVVFMPTFVWAPGKLYLQEIQVLKALGDNRLCLDRKFSLTFSNRPDPRDLRPCSYDGRFVTSQRFPVDSGRWKAAELVRLGRLDGGSLIRGAEMRKVVECDEKALPNPACDQLNKAQRWCQLGAPAWECLLRSVVNGVATLAEPNAVLMVVDLQPDVGDMGLATLQYACVCNIPVALVMIAEGPNERDYLHHLVHEAATKAWKAGKLPKAENPKPIKEDVIHEPKLHRLMFLH